MYLLPTRKTLGGLLLLILLAACSTNRPVDFQGGSSTEKPVVTIKLLQSQLRVGEWLAFRYKLSRAGYINIYALNSSGRTMQLVRNKPINKSGWHEFPSNDEHFDIKISGPVGTERFILVYTEQPFNPILRNEFKTQGKASELTLTGGQLQHRLDQATRSLRSNRWARADATLRIY